MGLESATYVSGLNTSNPVGTDSKSQGDDHLRLIKSVLQSTFPNASKAFRFPTATALDSGDSPYTQLASEANTVYVCDSSSGSIEIDLLAAATAAAGFVFAVAKTSGSNSVTLDPSGAETINGASSLVLSADNAVAIVYCTGSTWYAAVDDKGADRSEAGDFTFSGEVNLDGPLALGPGTELTISTGSITPTGNYHSVDTESDASSDNLDTISTSNIPDGGLLLLVAENGSRDVVVRDNQGNIQLNSDDDFTLDDTEKCIVLQRRGSTWYEVVRTGSTAATQSEMEAASSVTAVVTPGRTQYHPGVAKFWIKFTGTGTIAIDDSHNVSSITDNTTGRYTVTIDTDFSSADWAVSITAIAIPQVYSTGPSGGMLAGAVDLQTSAENGGSLGLTDAAEVYVAGFGDQ